MKHTVLVRLEGSKCLFCTPLPMFMVMIQNLLVFECCHHIL